MFRSRNHSRSALLGALTFTLVLGACSPAQSEDPASPAAPIEDNSTTLEAGDPDSSDADPEPERDEPSTLPITASVCANNLFPLEVGNQWVYALDPEDSLLEVPEPDLSLFTRYTWTVIDVNESQATLEMTSEEPAFTAAYTLECAEGAILTFPSLSLDLALGGGDFGSANLEYSRGSGVFLPSIETLEDHNWDYEWQTELLLSGEMRTLIDESQAFLATMNESTFLLNWSTAGSGRDSFETIEVLAGEFEALRLNTNSDMSFDIDMGGTSITAEIATEESQWYAPGIGLLQTTTYAAEMAFSGMSLPAGSEEGDITLTLIEFRSGAE
ncbi:MAG: hypothetical protein P1P76_08855 [Anaerolineales bacterium]|nr:hypothetical protein [Anaerolineales bacterium]